MSSGVKDEELDEEKTSLFHKPSVEKQKFNFKLLVHFFRVYWRMHSSPESKKFGKFCTFCALTFLELLVVGQVIVFTYVGYHVMLYPPKMSKNIVDGYAYDFNKSYLVEFLYILGEAFLVIMIAVSLDTFGNTIIQLLSVYWRKQLTSSFHMDYFENMYDILILDKRVDNPDERLTSDINSFTTLLGQIFVSSVTSVSSIVYYTYQSFINIGWQGPVFVYCFFIFGTIISYVLTYPLINLWYEQEKKEGDFRFSHTMVRNNVESISFLKGGFVDYKKNEVYLSRNVNNFLKIIFANTFLKVHMSTFGYIGAMANYLVLFVIAYLFHSFVLPSDSPGDVVMKIQFVSFQVLSLINGFTVLIQLGQNFSQMSGLLSRLGHMTEVIGEIKKNKVKLSKSVGTVVDFSINSDVRLDAGLDSPSEDLLEDYSVSFSDVSIYTPTKRLLLNSLNFSLNCGESLLIYGPNGCGKTTILRMLGGLWNDYSGQIKKPASDHIFQIPQYPYLFIGSLREQIVYPMVNLEFDHQLFHKVLKLVDLDRILRFIESIEEEYNWNEVLSGGEKQKLGFARFFYHYYYKPTVIKILVMDESTGNLDLDAEREIMKKVSSLGISIISVAHRFTLLKYHTKILKIKKGGDYIFQPMEKVKGDILRSILSN